MAIDDHALTAAKPSHGRSILQSAFKRKTSVGFVYVSYTLFYYSSNFYCDDITFVEVIINAYMIFLGFSNLIFPYIYLDIIIILLC